MIKSVYWFPSRVPFILDRFLKNTQISNLIKVHPVGAELFHADGQTDRETEMTKLIVATCNFARVLKNVTLLNSI